MLDQNTDRMWYVIGAVIVGAALIFIINSTMPELFASVADGFGESSDEAQLVVSDIQMQAEQRQINAQSMKEMQDRDAVGVTEGQLLHYDFLSGSGNRVSDQSGQGRDGVLHGFDHTAQSGWGRHGLVFDGENDYIQGPSELFFPDETITMHVRAMYHDLDYETGTGGLGTLLKKGHPDRLTPHAGFTFSYENRHNRSTFAYTSVGNANGGFNGGGNGFSTSSVMRLQNDRMYTFSVTVDEYGLARLYVDGVLHVTQQFRGAIQLNTSAVLYIGTWNSRYHPNVTIQSVRIYDRALEPVEILQNHKAESGG